MAIYFIVLNIFHPYFKVSFLDLILAAKKSIVNYTQELFIKKDGKKACPFFQEGVLNISSCTFGTGYGLEHISFTSSFISKSTGYVFKVQSVPLNKSSKNCNDLSNS